jgi:choline dehydrogenase-like flavoprotein
MVPDMDALAGHLRNEDPDWITLTLRGIGEMSGDRGGTPGSGEDTSWMDLSPYDVDEFGARRAFVHVVASPGDVATWKAMDACALALARAVAGADGNIEYLYDGGWQASPFPLSRPFPEWHRGLGTTHHESGTLWMGEDPATSVSAPTGRLHHMRNVYACDQSLFPTVGSVNPVLTGLTLARRVAESIPT